MKTLREIEEEARARRVLAERPPISSSQARALVDEFLALLAGASPRIEVAGSLRRLEDAGAEREDMHDVELVAEESPGIMARLDRLLIEGRIKKAPYIDKNDRMSYRWGPRYRGVSYPDHAGLRIELFLSHPDDWGYQLWLRTGPGDANKYIMEYLQRTPLSFRGASGWYRFDNGEARLQILNEEVMFGLLGLPYCPPGQRTLRWYQENLRLLPHAAYYRMFRFLPDVADERTEPPVQQKLF